MWRNKENKLLAIVLIILTCISQSEFRVEAFNDSNLTEVKEPPAFLTVEEIMDEYLSAVNKNSLFVVCMQKETKNEG